MSAETLGYGHQQLKQVVKRGGKPYTPLTHCPPLAHPPTGGACPQTTNQTHSTTPSCTAPIQSKQTRKKQSPPTSHPTSQSKEARPTNNPGQPTTPTTPNQPHTKRVNPDKKASHYIHPPVPRHSTGLSVVLTTALMTTLWTFAGLLAMVSSLLAEGGWAGDGFALWVGGFCVGACCGLRCAGFCCVTFVTLTSVLRFRMMSYDR